MNITSLEDAQRLIAELQVHQIELEMQNDELRQTHEQLNVEREKYADLYNFAPVAYFIFDDRDIILDLNLAAAELLGNERKYLVDHPLTAYITSESIQSFVEHRQKALETRLPQTCELTIRRRDGTLAFVQVRTIALHANSNGIQLWRSVMTDITERKHAEENLNYQAHLLGSVSDVIIATDASLRIANWNKPAELLYGWSAAEAIGQHIDELCHTEFIGQTQAEAQVKLLEEKVWYGELRQRRRDESMLWVTSSVSLLEDAQGNFTGGVAINHDITELKRAENVMQARMRITEFAAKHSLGKLLQNALDELCALTDSPIGFFHFVEPDQKTLALQAWSTRTLQEFCTAQGSGQHYDIDQAGVWVDCVREGRPVIHNDYASLPHRKGLPEGHASVIREMVFPITRYQKIVAIIGVGNKPSEYTQEDLDYASRLADLIWDITERKRAETELLEKELQYRTLANSGLALIWTSGTDKLFNYFNEPWLRFTGRTLEQEMGNGWTEGIHPDDFDKCLQIYIESFDKRKAFDMEYRLRHVSGEYRWIRDMGTPNYNSAGEFIGYIGHCFDISENKRAVELIHKLNSELEARVAERTSQLEASNTELEAFSYSISHDLRTPLRAIHGYARLLEFEFAESIPPKGISHLGNIRTNAEKMGYLIDYLVKFTRLGRQKLHVQTVQHEKLVNQALQKLDFEYEKRHVDIMIGDLPPSTGDPILLYQVWTNLLSNALKYTRKREIAQVEVGHMVGENGENIYYVRDNGIGFDMAYADKIFSVFERLNQDEEFEGTGVGLAFVKRIIQKHGGHIWVKAEIDNGAIFYFSFPKL